MSTYTEGEVAVLLGMTRDEAIACDGPRSALFGADSGSGEAAIPVIARWWDVRRARERVLDEAEPAAAAVAAVEAGGRGVPQRETAVELGISQPTVARLSRSLRQRIVEELNR